MVATSARSRQPARPAARHPGIKTHDPPNEDSPISDRPGPAEQTAAPDRPDGTSAAAIVTLCTYTWFLYGIGPSITLFRDELGVSSSVAGLHSLMLAAGVVLAGFVGVGLVRRWARFGLGQRAVVIVAAGIAVLCAGSLVTGVELAITLPTMLVIGLAGGLALNVSTTVLQEHHGRFGPAVLTLANAAAAGVGLITPLAVGAATALGLTWRAALILVVPFAVAAFVLIGRQRAVPAYAARPVGDGRFSVRGFPAAYWPAVLGVVCAVAVEFCLITWTPDLLVRRTGMSPGTASGMVAAVVGGMAVGRLTLAPLARRWSPRALFLIGVAVTLAGWALAWLSDSAVLSVAGLLILGLGLGGQYPLGASMAITASGGHPDRAVAVLSVGVGLASGLGPFGVATLSDAVGVQAAFLVIPLLAVGAAAGVLGAARLGPTG
jgi:MFS family permease